MTPPRLAARERPAGPLPVKPSAAGASVRACSGDAVRDRPALSTQHSALSTFLRQERSSFGYAFQGVAYSWRTQRHLRVHACLALACLALGLALSLRPAEWASLIAMIALVTALEMLNTVVEVVVDLISPAYHPGAKVAKDVAAGAVLIAAAGAVLVGAFIFVPRLLALLP